MGRIGSACLLLLALLLPVVASIGPLPKALLACMGLLLSVKILQLDHAAAGSVMRRHPLWHALAPFDIESARAVRPGADRIALLEMLAYGVLASIAWLGLSRPWPMTQGLPLVPLFLGMGLVYCGMETLTVGLRFAHRLAGVEVSAMQRAPILARSIGEFWSERWNRPVSTWLNRYVFRPVTRRHGHVLAMLSTFAISAALHAWLFFVAVGWRAAAMAGSFFLLQGVLVLLEHGLCIQAWPSVARRAWTVGLLLFSSPLFVLPVLQVLRVDAIGLAR